MRYETSDKLIAWLTLLSGLTISAVAIYYSVAGLVAIFSAAVIPIIVMGVALEVSKLAATVWLKQNWTRAPNFIRGYLLAAIAILMLITSMGIFGFLSKAHSDQSLVSGDVQSKIAVYDEKIKTAKDNIDANRKALKQMDEAVDQVMGRSTDEKGADKAVALRRGQAKERSRLLSEIAAEQKTISQLSEERAPIAAEVRKVEAEVGPIKYIANFIYGDNPDANILEKAVTWVIIIIVIVFDPLAVILLLASQYSFQWFRQQKEETPQEDNQEMSSDLYELENVKDQADTKQISWPFTSALWPFPKQQEITEPKKEEKEEDFKFLAEDKDLYPEGKPWEDKPQEVVEDLPLDQWNKMIEEAEKAVEKEKVLANVEWTDALQKWRDKNHDADIYEIQRAFDAGEIEVLPWDEENADPWMEELVVAKDETVDPVAEAKKWAEEQQQKESKKKTTYIIKEGDHQIQKTKDS